MFVMFLMFFSVAPLLRCSVLRSSVHSVPSATSACGLRDLRGSCYRLSIHGSPSHPLSPVRRIDDVSMHLYGAGIRMVRDLFSSAALRLSSL